MSRLGIGRLFSRRSPDNLESQPARHHFPLPAGHHLFRKCVTRPIPPTATVSTYGGKRTARWKTRAGKWATAEVVARPDGREVISVESSTFFAKYRDADGTVRVVPTGCRDESAARQTLARLERDAERVKA